jgi:ubiquinone/menaquinone biosynthesis C-methylase UbiE
MKKSKDSEIVGFYEGDAEMYDADRFSTIQGIYTDRAQKQIVLSMVNSCNAKRILDLGCGTGRFSIEIAKQGAGVTALDPSRSMLEQMKRKKNNAEINLIHGNGYKLPFKDNIFDGVVCINVINHVTDYNILIREISRVLQKDGFVIMTISNFFSFYLPLAVYVNITKRSVQNDVYTKWTTRAEIKKSLTAAGFEIDDIVGYIVFPKRHVPKLLMNMLKKLDNMCRHSPLRYIIPGSLFVKAIKKEKR